MKALTLVSGGFDSSVSTYLMKEKASLTALHFSLEPYTDDEPERKARESMKMLGIADFRSVNISKGLKEIYSKCDNRFYFVLLKVLMYRVAEAIALKGKYDFMITGENLGQVSSQTLDNLLVLDQSVKVPIIRPLISFDKQEIMDLSKKIGVYEINCIRETCDILSKEKPSTHTTHEMLDNELKKIDMDGIVKDILGGGISDNSL